ncbi:MAG TPA: ankyrin repeat domain-containing protein [Candidatus Wallbacteria bacterium]|nr:ankyrin repeat domain-containing protein [Candidatus Wallbacteria bacterium]
MKKICLLFIFIAVFLFNPTGASAPAAEEPSTYEVNETAATGDYSYTVINSERKKEAKADFYYVKINVMNKSEFLSGKIPQVKIVDDKGKELSQKEDQSSLGKNSSAIISLSFEIPKTAGECKLKVSGDDAGLSCAFINLSPSIVDAPNDLFAAARDGDVTRIKKALDGGAKINNKNSKGETPLHFAARAGKAEAVKFLLKKGADSWAKNSYDEPPLFYAIFAKNYDCVKLLLEAGSDTKYKSLKGRRAIEEAYKKYNKAIIEIVRAYTDAPTKPNKLKSDSK